MKTILVDAVFCLVSETGELFQELFDLLETYPNEKLVVTNAPLEKFPTYGLDHLSYKVFTLQRNPLKTDPAYFQQLLQEENLTAESVVYFEHDTAAVESAQSVDITSYHYDEKKKDLAALKEFLDTNLG